MLSDYTDHYQRWKHDPYLNMGLQMWSQPSLSKNSKNAQWPPQNLPCLLCRGPHMCLPINQVPDIFLGTLMSKYRVPSMSLRQVVHEDCTEDLRQLSPRLGHLLVTTNNLMLSRCTLYERTKPYATVCFWQSSRCIKRYLHTSVTKSNNITSMMIFLT
jgi:hypothetical protein